MTSKLSRTEMETHCRYNGNHHQAPLVTLTGQGNNRSPDADITRWLCWIFLGLAVVLAVYAYYNPSGPS